MMQLKHGLLAVATAMAITGAASAAECYAYSTIGFDADGGHMFGISGVVHNTYAGETADSVMYTVTGFELETSVGNVPFDSVTYSQFAEDIEGKTVYGVGVDIQIDAMTSLSYKFSFGGYTDIFTLQPYMNEHGVGDYFVDDTLVGIYTQSSLTAVPGSSALPLAGLAGLAVGRRRRRSNK